MTQFSVDTDVMSSAAVRVGEAVQRLQVMVSAMRADVNEMLAGWAGDGARAHRGLHERFEADVSAVISSLGQMQEGLQRTHQVYVTQEQRQTSDHTVMRAQISQ